MSLFRNNDTKELIAAGQTKRKFFDEQYKSWIYCSDDVVKAINEMVQLVISSGGKKSDTQKGVEVVGNIVLAMRRDLLGKTKLSYKDFRYTDIHD